MDFNGLVPWAKRRKKALGLSLLVGLTYCAVALTVSLSDPAITFPPAPAVQRAVMKVPPADNSGEPLRTIWFGHSLMEYRAAPAESVPKVNIPETVDAIHALARADGRTTRPMGITVSHYDGPKDLQYWNGRGKALEKIKDADKPWDYVVGVGFLHLVQQKGGRHCFRSQKLAVPNFVDDTTAIVKDLLDIATFGRYYGRTVRQLTYNKYDLIRQVHDVFPSTTWVNYVGPVLKDRAFNQASVDARFSCIQETALAAGAKVKNVRVGAAVRRAEEMLKDAGLLVELQRADRLHYTAMGAYLASLVFYVSLYDIDPRGLPVPESLGSYFSGAEGSQVVGVLQQSAFETVADARSGMIPCGTARLPVDDEGANLLKQAK